MTSLSRLPCAKCGTETLHVSLACTHCGTAVVLPPLKPEKPSARHTIGQHKQRRRA